MIIKSLETCQTTFLDKISHEETISLVEYVVTLKTTGSTFNN